MILSFKKSFCPRGFTLAEVVISLALAAMMIGGIVYGYTMSAIRAEWSSYSLAAQALAVQKIEQTRAARWLPQVNNPIDELIPANFPSPQRVTLDVPQTGQSVYATNFTTISDVTVNPPLRMIKVDCIWSFRGKRFTNSIATYRAPDQAVQN